MSETIATQTTKTEKPPLPILACPNCGENLLAKGFYNSCSEVVSLREDNYAFWSRSGDRLYLDHTENNHETHDHECDLEAYCVQCDQLLPWPLYQIRQLDWNKLPEIEAAIAELIAAAREAEPATA